MNLRRQPVDRQGFIAGSDARIVMGSDEAALLRLWREKRGEAEPEDRAFPASADREQRELLPGLDCRQ